MIANTGKLAGLTVFITGASRGIGKAIAVKVARDGANVVVAAKTAEPHPKLPGTIYTACEEIEKAGGKCLPCVVDVRDEVQVRKAVEEAVQKFGGIDILVNNASAISLTGTAETEMKRYDLMHNINTRGTFLVSKECLPYLKKSKHAHILNMSPPLLMTPRWFGPHVAYTMAKYGMSMCVLGMHDEFRPFNIGVNALWPKTAIHTAAMEMLGGSEFSFNHSRKPDVLADAAYHIFIQDPKTFTGQFFIDEELLQQAGVQDMDQYACNPKFKNELHLDFFIPEKYLSDDKKMLETSGGKPKEAEASSAGGSHGDTMVGKIFNAIESRLSDQLVQSTQAVYEFELTGAEAGKYFLDLKNEKGSCGKGSPSAKVDATLKMDSKHFAEMFSGKLKPATAYMMGKLKITGNLQKALKLEALMKSLKSKM